MQPPPWQRGVVCDRRHNRSVVEGGAKVRPFHVAVYIYIMIVVVNNLITDVNLSALLLLYYYRAGTAMQEWKSDC